MKSGKGVYIIIMSCLDLVRPPSISLPCGEDVAEQKNS